MSNTIAKQFNPLFLFLLFLAPFFLCINCAVTNHAYKLWKILRYIHINSPMQTFERYYCAGPCIFYNLFPISSLFTMASIQSGWENKCNKLFLQGFSCYKRTNKSDRSGWALLYMLVGRKNETDAFTHAIRKRVYFNSSFWWSFFFFFPFFFNYLFI